MNNLKSFVYKILDFLFEIRNNIFKSIFIFCPVKENKVLFNNFNGRGYGDNPKYILEELKNEDFDFVWLTSNLEENMPSAIRKVHPNSIKRLYETATAKVIVTNVKNDLRFIKKKGQYVIQTWHGSYSSKRLEAAAADTLSPKYLKESRKNSKQTDLFISNSRVLSDCYRKDFWCDCEIMECGFPRNDILFKENTGALEKVTAFFNIKENCKLAMYAPTFRDDGSVDAYKIDAEKIVEALEKDGNKWKLLIRMHPNVEECDNLFPFDENILNATKYPDMQELLVATDLLITDYSSTVFEFAAMEKAVFLYTPDIEEYEKIRGLMPTFFQMPYKKNLNNDELIQDILESSSQKQKQLSQEFTKIFGGVDDGTSSSTIAKRIKDVINGNKF
ncbi:MAG: CDP-glycerol glycerophosphotransferase family protein [Clostridia bacterium]|nr:CDP-glycerol glycerophosphotransferase family protein [Clostridia bacterium]MBQ9977736.1 CDP-glycerol glycerophosphotransferase family protein [Clostridia bacterium]